MAEEKALSAKHAAFVAEYLATRNATKAATAAGYSKKSAHAIGGQLLERPDIAAAIAKGSAEVAERAGVTAERIIQERARIAFADIRKICGENGMILMPHQLDADTAAAVVSFKVDVEGRIEYRFAGKDPSLAALEKRLGLTEKAIRFPLPDATDIDGCAAAQDAVLQAVAAGNLLPSEGQALGAMIENKRRALENHDLAKRLEAIEDKLNLKGATA